MELVEKGQLCKKKIKTCLPVERTNFYENYVELQGRSLNLKILALVIAKRQKLLHDIEHRLILFHRSGETCYVAFKTKLLT